MRGRVTAMCHVAFSVIITVYKNMYKHVEYRLFECFSDMNDWMFSFAGAEQDEIVHSQ